MATATFQKERTRAQRILRTLRKNLEIRNEDFASLLVAKESGDPFRVLVVTILSQNCTDVASVRAYRQLDERVGVTVNQIQNADLRKIRQAIRAAGLYRQKARAIKKLAQILNEKYGGHLSGFLRGPVEEARENLQTLPKVGPKTADVLLSVWGRPTVSVDTHVDRVSKRLGFAPPKAKYVQVRGNLMNMFRKEDYTTLPLLLMAHGRKTCKAIRPLCPACPVLRLCPYPNKTRQTIKRFQRQPLVP